KLEGAAVQLVGTRRGNDGDLTTSALAVLGSGGVLHYVELADRIYAEQLAAGAGRSNHLTAGIRADEVNAVNHEPRRLGPFTGNGKRIVTGVDGVIGG